MKRTITKLAIGTLLGTCALSAQAMLTNGGFEAGLTGWTAAVPTGAAAGTTAAGLGGITPIEGAAMGAVKTDGPGNNVTLSQSVSLGVNGSLSGYVNWYDAELAGNQSDFFNDNVWVKIFDSSNALVETAFYDQHAGNSDIVNGWDQWSFTAGASDTYTLQFGIQNIGDSVFDSWAYFDKNAVTNAPEPGILALLGLGLAGLGFRRFKRV